MKFILPMNAFINASKCVAKNDPRYYLEGVHVTKNTIEATNGHYLYQAKLKDTKHPSYILDMYIEDEKPESMIIKMIQPIKKPAKKEGCEFVLFEVENKRVIATVINQFGQQIGVYLGETIDCGFPDANRVIPEGEPECHSQVGFNSEYLKKVSDVCEGKFKGVRMQSFGEHRATKFEMLSTSNYYSAIFVLMPIRL